MRDGRRRTPKRLLDDPSVRLLTGLALSLSLMVALARLPLREDGPSRNWLQPSNFGAIVLTQPRPERSEADPMHSAIEASALVDRTQPPTEEPSAAEEITDEAELAEPAPPDSSPTEVRGTREQPMQMFELAGTRPKMVGGQGALYMHIAYPEDARRLGIEGRVLVEFIVDGEGRVHEAEVIQSVHPSLDSAALRAVRRTTFNPGQHEGENVAVRMHLPVRFQLIGQK